MGSYHISEGFSPASTGFSPKPEGFSPQHDLYQLMRRYNPSPMSGKVLDRASERLCGSGHILADVPINKLKRLLALPYASEREREAIQIELDRRAKHSTFDSEEPPFECEEELLP